MIRTLFLTLSLVGLLCACSEQQYESVLDQTIQAQRWMAGWQPQQVQVGDVRVHYLDNLKTDAQHTLLFVHGYTGNKDMWNRLATRIPSQYRLIALDLLGHGNTDNAPDNRYLLMQQAELLNQFLRTLNLDRVHLVGSSMGGATALLFALHHTDNIETLTLMNSAGVHADRESPFEHAIATGKNPMAIQTIEDFDTMMALIFHDAPWVPQGFKQVLSKRANTRYQHNQYILSEVMLSAHIWRDSGRLYGLMPAFKKPVLIIWGEDDRVLDASSVAVFKDHLPQAETHIFAETGHVPMLEQPAKTANTLMSFLTHHTDAG